MILRHGRKVPPRASKLLLKAACALTGRTGKVRFPPLARTRAGKANRAAMALCGKGRLVKDDLAALLNLLGWKLDRRRTEGKIFRT